MSDSDGESPPQNVLQPQDQALALAMDQLTPFVTYRQRGGLTSINWATPQIPQSSAKPELGDIDLEDIPGPAGLAGLNRPICIVPRVEFWRTRNRKISQAHFSRLCRRGNREARAKNIAEQRRKLVETARARLTQESGDQRLAVVNDVVALNSASGSSINGQQSLSYPSKPDFRILKFNV